MVTDEDFNADEIVADAMGGKIRESPGNPYDVALELIDEWDAGPGRRSWRGDFYRYTGTRWVMEHRDDVMREVNRELGKSLYFKTGSDGKKFLVKWSPNNSSLANVENQLFFHSSMHTELEPVRGGEYVFLENGRYCIQTGTLLKHDRDIFNLHASPFPYDPKAECPSFDRLLKETFGGDDVAIRRHLLWMGAELIHATDLQIAMVLIGQPGSGKGTLMKISNALIGANQVTGVSLDQLAGDFNLAPLIGKSVCRINDVRDTGKSTVQAVQRLLSIIGGDIVQIDRKHKDPWQGALPVLFTLESNEMIHLPDASQAIQRRLVPNRTVGTRMDHMDPNLAQRIISGEMPGVLNRVLAEIDGVYGVWPETEASRKVKEEMTRLSAPLLAWVEDCGYIRDASETIQRDEAYQSYVAWAHENGIRSVYNKSWFMRNLLATLPDIRSVRRGPANSQEWWVDGLGSGS